MERFLWRDFRGEKYRGRQKACGLGTLRTYSTVRTGGRGIARLLVRSTDYGVHTYGVRNVPPCSKATALQYSTVRLLVRYRKASRGFA